MPNYKGNRGNLLQHWVLAELVLLLRDSAQAPGMLCFIDAHAMSPYAIRNESPGQTASDFDRVAGRLPGQSTEYERAWHALSCEARCRYPSSAAFVRHLWRGPMHLVLCEADEPTANEIAEWQQRLGPETSVELYRGDWRVRFRQDFPEGSAAYLLSFDPYMIDRHSPRHSPKLGNMWPGDILRAGNAVLGLSDCPIVLQLSTYSANHANSQEDVIAIVEPILAAAGLELAARVRADGNMMSLVFSRDAPLIRDAQLPQRFTAWMNRAT
jgi:hypothetical protein